MRLLLSFFKKNSTNVESAQKPHRIFTKYGLNHIVPLSSQGHRQVERFIATRSFYSLSNTNIILSGGVDDVWQDIKTGKLIIADYKSC